MEVVPVLRVVQSFTEPGQVGVTINRSQKPPMA